MRRAFVIALIVLSLPSLAWAQDVDSLIRKGERQVGHGNLEAAHKTFIKVLKEEPDNSTAISALAQIASFLKNHHESVFWYTVYLYVEASYSGETEDIKELIEKEAGQISNPGELTVNVTPSYAELRMNGSRVGKGSVTLKTIGGSEFMVEVEAEDFHSDKRKITVQSTETKVVNINLKKIIYKGMLEIKTLPKKGVDVYVDTKKLGKDVRKVKLTEGKHLVCFKKKGYDRWWRYVTVQRDSSTFLESNMREQTRPDEPCTVTPDEY
jgi:hypothetical protein